jgi:tRNA (cmo5U34)-methyltransferase
MENIRKHFEEEAHAFDQIITCLIPYYSQMVEALAAGLPFGQATTIRVIDLGCGTGSIARAIKDSFPQATITCVDMAEKMLAMARGKLGSNPDVRYQLANFETYEFDAQYDAVVSSLALHHLVTDGDKQVFYRKIYDSLAPGGVFYNADVILGSSDYLQELNIDKWKRFMRQHISEEEIVQKWMPKHYEEDRPARMMEQLVWLREIGFVELDVLWKYYNFGVFGGRKPRGLTR